MSARSEIQKRYSQNEIEEGNMFLYNIPFQSNDESKHCFKFTFTSQKLIWFRRAEFTIEASVEFSIDMRRSSLNIGLY